MTRRRTQNSKLHANTELRSAPMIGYSSDLASNLEGYQVLYLFLLERIAWTLNFSLWNPSESIWSHHIQVVIGKFHLSKLRTMFAPLMISTYQGHRSSDLSCGIHATYWRLRIHRRVSTLRAQWFQWFHCLSYTSSPMLLSIQRIIYIVYGLMELFRDADIGLILSILNIICLWAEQL